MDRVWKYALVLILTMGLSGLWHGAAWNFVLWGLYYAVLIFVYRYLGMGGRWIPSSVPGRVGVWVVMFCFIVFGWLIFRSPDISWLVSGLKTMFYIQSSEQLVAALVVLSFLAVYSFPLFVLMFLDRVVPKMKWLHAIVYGISLAVIICFYREAGQDFIYFQF